MTAPGIRVLFDRLIHTIPFLEADPDRGIYRNKAGTYPDPDLDGIRRFTLKNRSAAKRMFGDFTLAMIKEAGEARKTAEVAATKHAAELAAAKQDAQAAVAREKHTVDRLRGLLPPDRSTDTHLTADEAIDQLRQSLHRRDANLQNATDELTELREALQLTRAELAKTQDTQQAERRRVALDWARGQFGIVPAADGSGVGGAVLRLAAQYEQYLASGAA